MGLREILKKKDELEQGEAAAGEELHSPATAEFTFLRTDTISQDVIHPPEIEPGHSSNHLSPEKPHKSPRRSLTIFRSSRSRSASASSQKSPQSPRDSGGGDGDYGLDRSVSSSGRRRRLSQRLHLSRKPESSEHVPQDLPVIVAPENPQDTDTVELQWEKRATILAEQNDLARSRPSSPNHGAADPAVGMASLNINAPTSPTSPQIQSGHRTLSRSPSEVRKPVSSKAIDDDIQEAIRLHEEGDLEKSTRIFGSLADENGANNPLSQVLYGLALRHGWGCPPEPEKAVKYLSAAASNAASVEQLALQAGLKKGGAAKGELVLAIFELANCFRHGWGIEKDPVAAKQYYETAANLGDTDAMNEIAFCYLEGIGCKKDKFASAKYYRRAEKAGSKTLGNSWIWKEKYDPPDEKGGKGKK